MKKNQLIFLKNKKTNHITKVLLLFLIFSCNANTEKCANNVPYSNINGVKFELQESISNISLRGVCAVSKSIAWTSGSQNSFARTINGGKSWSWGEIGVEKKLDFRDIEAFNADTALVLSAGKPAKIYKTINGGKKWKETYHNNEDGIFFNSMAFWDAKNGIAVGDPMGKSFIIITTSDGGESWNKIPNMNIPEAYPGEAQFAASGTCITVQKNNIAWFATGGTKTRIFKTTDKGKNWIATNTPLKKESSSSGIFSIAFKNELEGIAVGGDYKNPEDNSENIILTKDGGITWFQPQNIPKEFRSCVSYIPDTKSNILLAIGKTGADFSIDGGATWNPTDSVGYYSLDFSKVDPVGWAVGSKGRIAKITCK